MSKTPLKQARSKNAIEAAILNRVLDRDWTLNPRGALSPRHHKKAGCHHSQPVSFWSFQIRLFQPGCCFRTGKKGYYNMYFSEKTPFPKDPFFPNPVLFATSTPRRCNCLLRKTPHTEGWDKVRGSVSPRFAAGLPFPAPEILEFVVLRDSGKLSSVSSGIFLQFLSGTPKEIPETVTAFSSFWS